MRKLIIAGLAAGFMTLAIAPAFADVAGTSEGTDGDGNPTNQVSCGTGAATLPDGSVIATEGEPGGPGALVLCNESGDIQGRIILAGDPASGGYVAADGDADNAEQGAPTGWLKVTVNADNPGVSCGENDSTTETGHDCSAP